MIRVIFLSAMLGMVVGGAWAADIAAVRAADMRNILRGERIPAESYVDQPYVVVTKSGAWVCTMTTGKGLEGQPGQHVVVTVSRDQGKSWSELVTVESEAGPEASWATPLLTPGGRIYLFYVYNGDEVVTLPNSDRRIRADMHGWYVFRYSDDEGVTWSAQRFRVPIRLTEVDKRNSWRGEVSHFWSIDKPKVVNERVYWALTKLGAYFMRDGEGWVIESPNILSESDPDRLVFNLLPEGDHGIRNPALGSVQEEHNLVPLGDNSLLCVLRLESGTPAQSISRDGGASWSLPQPMTYGPGKRHFKTPRANAKIFKTAAGNYLFWFHHNGLRGWSGRNPAFLSGGILGDDGEINWSEPELVLFDVSPGIRMGYPDLIEQDGRFWLTETQKSVARVHAVDDELVRGLWRQQSIKEVCRTGLVLEKFDASDVGSRPTIPRAFGDLTYGGVTVELLFELESEAAGVTLFSSLDSGGAGVRVVTAELDGKLTCAIELSDGMRATLWHSDPGAVQVGSAQHLVFICDFSATILSVVANGVYLDGGATRAFGWGRLPPEFGAVRGSFQGVLAPQVKGVRLYERPLRVTEAIGNFRASVGEERD